MRMDGWFATWKCGGGYFATDYYLSFSTNFLIKWTASNCIRQSSVGLLIHAALIYGSVHKTFEVMTST